MSKLVQCKNNSNLTVQQRISSSSSKLSYTGRVQPALVVDILDSCRTLPAGSRDCQHHSNNLEENITNCSGWLPSIRTLSSLSSTTTHFGFLCVTTTSWKRFTVQYAPLSTKAQTYLQCSSPRSCSPGRRSRSSPGAGHSNTQHLTPEMKGQFWNGTTYQRAEASLVWWLDSEKMFGSDWLSCVRGTFI